MINCCHLCNYWKAPSMSEPCKTCLELSGPPVYDRALWEDPKTCKTFIVHGRPGPITLAELAQEIPQEDLYSTWRDLEAWPSE